MVTETTKKQAEKNGGVSRFLPIVEWLPNYDRAWLKGDIIADQKEGNKCQEETHINEDKDCFPFGDQLGDDPEFRPHRLCGGNTDTGTHPRTGGATCRHRYRRDREAGAGRPPAAHTVANAQPTAQEPPNPYRGSGH